VALRWIAGPSEGDCARIAVGIVGDLFMQSPIRPIGKDLMCAASAILLVAAAGVSLAFQGWNSRLMNFDHVNFIDGAAKFLSDGVLPDRGDVSSYWAYNTPGTAWLMVPGMLVFHDPRLFESVGSATLYVGTLVGVFLLARKCFGTRCAYLSLMTYGLSRNGLFNAGSLWSIGNPFFYVWMVYFCVLGVTRESAAYLAAAIVMWSVGMYVDMVLAPAMFILPAIWLIYRPPLRLAPLLVAACAILAVWYPFLRFQRSRHFADLKSIVMLKPNSPTNYKASWCVPELRIQKPDSDAKSVASPSMPLTAYEKFKQHVRARSNTVKEGLVFNFDQMTFTPLAALPLLLLAVTTLAVMALQRPLRFLGAIDVNDGGRQRVWIVRIGGMLLGLALVSNEALVAGLLSTTGHLVASTVWTIRTVQACLVLFGLILILGWRQILELRRRVVSQPVDRRKDSQYLNTGLFAVGLLVPWLVLIAVAEGGLAVRYFWIWPLQLIAIVAAVTFAPERLGWSRAGALCCQIGLVAVLLTHPWLVAPLRGWMSSGWSGPMASDIQAADYLGARLLAEGRHQAAVGYQTYVMEFMAAMNIADPRYKIGAELDMFLKYRYGIANADQCAEGISSEDEYRIVQKPPVLVDERPLPESWSPLGSEVRTYTLTEHVEVPRDPRFHLLKQFGDFGVFERTVSDGQR
jgi:hypothetical protein